MTPLQSLQAIAGSLKEGQLRLALALATLAEDSPHHSVKVSTRALCKAANLSESALPAALRALEGRQLITIRHGGPGSPNAYLVNFLNTVRGASFAEAPPASFGEAPLPLFERRPASFPEAPPSGNKELTSTDARVDLSTALPTILDRVLKSRPTDFDEKLLAYTRRYLHSYMGKLGRDEHGDAYVPGRPPVPPDDRIVAQLLAVADPPALFAVLDNLVAERKAAPYSYGWFVTVTLQRIHGISWSQTKKARAQLAVVRRGGRPVQPADVHDFTQQTLAEIGAIAKAKAIR